MDDQSVQRSATATVLPVRLHATKLIATLDFKKTTVIATLPNSKKNPARHAKPKPNNQKPPLPLTPLRCSHHSTTSPERRTLPVQSSLPFAAANLINL